MKSLKQLVLGFLVAGISIAPQTETAALALDDSETSAVDPVVGGPVNGICANANAEFIYSAWANEGGARPRPGMTTGEQKLIYMGNVIGHSITREQGENFENNDRGTPWEISLQFVNRTKKVLSLKGNQQSGSEIFVQKVKATWIRGLSPSVEGNQFAIFVICNNSWDLLRP